MVLVQIRKFIQFKQKRKKIAMNQFIIIIIIIIVPPTLAF